MAAHEPRSTAKAGTGFWIDVRGLKRANAYERQTPVPNSLLALCKSTFDHSSNDAARIALATVSSAYTVVSWDFKHFVHSANRRVRRREYRAWLPKPRDLFTPRGCDAMKPEREFDCVGMKTESQAQLLREVAELGEDEAQRRRAERLSRDPILGGFLRTKMAVGKDSVEHTPAA